MGKSFTSVVVLALGALAAGCASYVPVNEFAQAKSSVRAAEEVGAAEHPVAAAYLRLARDQIGQAGVLVNSGEGDKASLVLQRARADAELALALAREEDTRTKAAEAVRRTHELEEQKP